MRPFNDKHAYLSQLKDFYLLKSFKKHLVVGPEKKKETQFVKSSDYCT